MRWINAGLHRILDFVTVVGFAVAPTLLGLEGLARLVAYTLAGVHLLLTVLTRFAPDGKAPVPLRLHGMVEMVVGPVLLIVPFALGWMGAARWFYVGAGAVIVVVWATSAYEARAGTSAA